MSTCHLCGRYPRASGVRWCCTREDRCTWQDVRTGDRAPKKRFFICDRRSCQWQLKGGRKDTEQPRCPLDAGVCSCKREPLSDDVRESSGEWRVVDNAERVQRVKDAVGAVQFEWRDDPGDEFWHMDFSVPRSDPGAPPRRAGRGSSRGSCVGAAVAAGSTAAGAGDGAPRFKHSRHDAAGRASAGATSSVVLDDYDLAARLSSDSSPSVVVSAASRDGDYHVADGKGADSRVAVAPGDKLVAKVGPRRVAKEARVYRLIDDACQAVATGYDYGGAADTREARANAEAMLFARRPAHHWHRPSNPAYIVMERLDGNLCTHLPSDEDELRRAGAAMVRALWLLHLAGCMHLDVAPQNVCWRSAGARGDADSSADSGGTRSAVLIDFGNCRPFRTARGQYCTLPASGFRYGRLVYAPRGAMMLKARASPLDDVESLAYALQDVHLRMQRAAATPPAGEDTVDVGIDESGSETGGGATRSELPWSDVADNLHRLLSKSKLGTNTKEIEGAMKDLYTRKRKSEGLKSTWAPVRRILRLLRKREHGPEYNVPMKATYEERPGDDGVELAVALPHDLYKACYALFLSDAAADELSWSVPRAFEVPSFRDA